MEAKAQTKHAKNISFITHSNTPVNLRHQNLNTLLLNLTSNNILNHLLLLLLSVNRTHIPFRHELTSTHNSERCSVIAEHGIDLLETLAHGLRVEEVDGERDAETDDAEKDEVVVADTGDGDGGGHNDDEVPRISVREGTIGRGAEGGTNQSQWLAVEIAAILTRSLTGATSAQYKKLAPRNPIGTKKLN